MSDQRFPLKWPGNWPRTAPSKRQRADFRKTERTTRVDGVGNSVTQTRETLVSLLAAFARLERQLTFLGVTKVVLSTNIELRLDGRPHGGRAESDDPGAAVYFSLNGAARCLACDRWLRVADNIAALAAHIDALRRIDRYGVGGIDQAFRGYTALQPATTEWWLVLGVSKDAPLDTIESAFLRLAKQHHPDRTGGNGHQMARVTEARALAVALRTEEIHG